MDMKYYKKELLRRFNVELSPNERNALNNKWKLNLDKYSKCLKKLKNVLSKNNYLFFEKVSLHDSNVDLIKLTTDTVVIELRNIDCDYKYTLKYSKIKSVKYDFPTEQPLFWKIGDGIGDWGYDEIELLDEDFLCHRILLQSGAILEISFKLFGYKKTKI
jgi:hypothetical protein